MRCIPLISIGYANVRVYLRFKSEEEARCRLIYSLPEECMRIAREGFAPTIYGPQVEKEAQYVPDTVYNKCTLHLRRLEA